MVHINNTNKHSQEVPAYTTKSVADKASTECYKGIC